MLDPKLRGIIYATAAAALVSGCGADDIASPGTGGNITINNPAAPPPPPPPPPPPAGVVAATGGPVRWIEWDHVALEYLAHVVWSPGAPLTLVLQNRLQTEVQIHTVNTSTGRTTMLHRETDEAWVNLDSNFPRWVASGTQFLWSTERAGFTALELRGANGALVRAVTTETDHFRTLLKVDHETNVYFSGGEDSSQTQVYKVSLQTPATRPIAVSQTPGEHEYLFSSDSSVRVHVEQHIDARRTWTFEQSDGTRIAAIASVAEQQARPPVVEMVTLGDAQFRAAIIRPSNFVAGQRYAVIDAIYGGPGSRTVTHARDRYALHQWIADSGFIVVAMDGRGTPFRGRAWERALKGHMGDVPLGDHRVGLQALAQRISEVDLTRVGVYGWSYGGYLAALALQQSPVFYHAAVAGAPVTDWRDYDTHYTERYLGLPTTQAASYDQSSVLTSVANVTQPLLLIHGTADDNVYFLHSLKLMNALLRAERRVEFFPLMGMTHIVNDADMNRLVYGRTTRFFREQLYRDLL